MYILLHKIFIIQGVCIIYDVLLYMRADLLDFLRLKVIFYHDNNNGYLSEFSTQFIASKKFNCLRLVIRVSVVLFAAIVMSAVRLSTGSPTFKPIDNAASFSDSLLTRVSRSHSSVSDAHDQAYIQLGHVFAVGIELQLLLHSKCLAFTESVVAVL